MTEAPVLDKFAALQRFDGDEQLWDEIVVLFLDDAPKQLEILEQALESGNQELATRQAHSLKSAAANIGGEAMREAALCSEVAARDEGMEAAKAAYPTLKDSFLELERELRK